MIATLVFSALILAAALTRFGGLWGVVVPLFGLVSSLGFIQGNAATEAMRLDPRRAGATASLTGAASFGVGAFCAALAGALHDGTAAPMAIVMVVSLAIGILSLRIMAPRPKARILAAVAP